jgi:hypothetical protein
MSCFTVCQLLIGQCYREIDDFISGKVNTKLFDLLPIFPKLKESMSGVRTSRNKLAHEVDDFNEQSFLRTVLDDTLALKLDLEHLLCILQNDDEEIIASQDDDRTAIQTLRNLRLSCVGRDRKKEKEFLLKSQERFDNSQDEHNIKNNIGLILSLESDWLDFYMLDYANNIENLKELIQSHENNLNQMPEDDLDLESRCKAMLNMCIVHSKVGNFDKAESFAHWIIDHDEIDEDAKDSASMILLQIATHSPISISDDILARDTRRMKPITRFDFLMAKACFLQLNANDKKTFLKTFYCFTEAQIILEADETYFTKNISFSGYLMKKRELFMNQVTCYRQHRVIPTLYILQDLFKDLVSINNNRETRVPADFVEKFVTITNHFSPKTPTDSLMLDKLKNDLLTYR